jgi:hypothetical protein
MSPKAQRLLEEALALPEDARTDPVEALIESLDAPASGAVKPIPWGQARSVIFGARD